MPKIIECVPNFSEGRDATVIRRITDAIETVRGATLLDVDPGQATHRTVVTFAGEPEAVTEAAVRAARTATELIDMREHHGEHPRFGALDVCPLVPVSGITMEETTQHALQLARRLGEEVGLTVFCYGHAARRPERRDLAAVRAGEYEGLAARLAQPDWQPDFGPTRFDPRSGATAVGAREFLVAYNVNLNTTSTRRANAVAFDVRERGRVARQGDPLTGEIVRDEKGEPVHIPGSLKAVKAIGWYIEEYGIAQISMNLTNLQVTPVHVAFDEVCRRAMARGLRVTGSELVGMIPLAAILDAGRHYLRQQRRSLGVPDHEIIKIAVKSLGLDDLRPFDPQRKIIEYRLAAELGPQQPLVSRSISQLVEATASESPAPGGGSVAAAVGALGAALGSMVANLSAHKRGWDARWEEFSEWAEQGKRCYESLLGLIDRDADSFNALLEAYRLPQRDADEQKARRQAIADATVQAIEVPLEIMVQAAEALRVIKAMAALGNPASVSDAGVGGLCARAAVRGAFLNVRINAAQAADPERVRVYLARAAEIDEQAERAEAEVLELVENRLDS